MHNTLHLFTKISSHIHPVATSPVFQGLPLQRRDEFIKEVEPTSPNRLSSLDLHLKSEQGHVKDCGVVAVINCLALRPDLRYLMNQAITKTGPNQYQVKFYSIETGKSSSISITQDEIDQPKGYQLKASGRRLNIIGSTETHYLSIGIDPISGKAVTKSYPKTDVRPLRGIRGPLLEAKIIELAYGKFIQSQESQSSKTAFQSLHLARAWDFAAHLTGKKHCQNYAIEDLTIDQLKTLTPHQGPNIYVYEPETEHTKTTTDQNLVTLKSGHTYSVIDIKPDTETITILSPLPHSTPLTFTFKQFLSDDELGAIIELGVL